MIPDFLPRTTSQLYPRVHLARCSLLTVAQGYLSSIRHPLHFTLTSAGWLVYVVSFLIEATSTSAPPTPAETTAPTTMAELTTRPPKICAGDFANLWDYGCYLLVDGPRSRIDVLQGSGSGWQEALDDCVSRGNISQLAGW